MAEKRDDTATLSRTARSEAPTQHAPLDGPVSATLRAAPGVGERVGRYVIERTIGHGGMGIVVAARHEQLGELVAIKLLHPKASKDEVQVERFVREARATVRIKSEHVVRVLDAGAEPTTGAPYIVMEHLEGRDLGQVLTSHGAMPVQMAVDYTIQICEAVGAAHALGIIHRDLKPSNFFLTTRPDGTPLVKVLDFGISKAAQADGSPDPRLTETQAVFGSPTYMSPEQIRSSKNVDPRSDVWSLGVALFEMITGKLPFVADNVAGLLASVIADPPLRIVPFVPDVPLELEATVLACLEKDPARRIGSTAELALRLAPFASPDGARLASRVERGVRSPSNSSQSLPPGAPLPGSAGFAPPLPPLPPLGAVAPAAVPLSHPSAPVSFGTTGTDLSATGPAAYRAGARSPAPRRVALALGGAVVLLGALGGAAYLARSHQLSRASAAASAPASATPPPPAQAAPEPSVVSGVSGVPGVSGSAGPGGSAASSADAPAAAAGARKGKPAPAPPGTSKTAPRASAAAPGSAHVAPPVAAPPPPPPASPNLDSRF